MSSENYFPLAIVYSYSTISKIKEELAQLGETFSIHLILLKRNNPDEQTGQTLIFITKEFWQKALQKELNLAIKKRQSQEYPHLRITPLNLQLNFMKEETKDYTYNGDLYVKIPSAVGFFKEDYHLLVKLIVQQAQRYGLLKELTYQLIIPRRNIDRLTEYVKGGFTITFPENVSEKDKYLLKTLINHYDLWKHVNGFKDKISNRILIALWKRQLKRK